MQHKCNGCRYKGEHQEMGFRSFGVCTKETNLIEAEKAYNADTCKHKAQTRPASDMNYTQMRPCLADGKEATFHRWSIKTNLFIKVNAIMPYDDMISRAKAAKEDGVIPKFFDTETIQRTVAIVEYEDGTVDEVESTKIKFICDDKVTRDYLARSKEVEIR